MVKRYSHDNPVSMPILVDHILRLRASGRPSPAILTFCFSDELPLKACLSACREARTIPVVMATINQVNSDGGYSGFTSAQFVRRINTLARESGYDGPIIFGRDHGGPYIVQSQKIAPRPEVMQWVRRNITLDLKAGFTCWHADGTSGVKDEQEDGQLPVELIAGTTLEMIAFCESERMRLGIAPISYEIGSEEQQGGLTSPEKFDRFLKLVTEGIFQKKLINARIDFVVAQTGTHMRLQRRNFEENYRLIQNGIKTALIQKLDHVAASYRLHPINLLFTQHYSDHISADDAASLLVLGIGKVNFGPEMTMPELALLLSWEKQERESLDTQGGMDRASGFRETMIHALDKNPEFWRDYIPAGRQGDHGRTLSVYPRPIQDAIIVFRGRYVKNNPKCARAIQILYRNVKSLGISADPEDAVITKIKKEYALPRIRQLGMENIGTAWIETA
jgi:tagatose-1,6-bisphosphate aldolase non-catalytic subunit AgaZ/GatZ